MLTANSPYTNLLYEKYLIQFLKSNNWVLLETKQIEKKTTQSLTPRHGREHLKEVENGD